MIQITRPHATANFGKVSHEQHIEQSPSLAQEQLSDMSDEQIFQMCRKYGSSAIYWRQKFIGLLPEVNRRRLYEKRGFRSIFEFAKKLAGLSEEQVRITLNLEKRFEDKPVLRELLVSGEVSINKLSRVVSIATTENEGMLAQQVKLLPNRVLETLVRDEKFARMSEGEFGNQNTSAKPLFEVKSLHVQIKEPQLANDVKSELFELQEKGIDINELLREFLQKRKVEIVKEKEQIANETATKDPGANIRTKQSRYIPAKIRNLLKKEHGRKCSMKTCVKPAETIHHTQRFFLSGTHDPHYLAPLCKEHHTIAHSIDLQFHASRMRARNESW
jgi:hypothetical protein